ELMHYENIDAAVSESDPTLLQDKQGANCVKGCYRCLLSYFNQPDHELIDRTDAEVLRVLLRLARSEVAPSSGAKPHSGNGDWHSALSRWGLPLPDSEPLVVA